MHTTLKQVQLGQVPTGDLRCACGKLLARVLHTVLELKCPRCKHVVLVVGGERFERPGAHGCECSSEQQPEPRRHRAP